MRQTVEELRMEIENLLGVRLAALMPDVIAACERLEFAWARAPSSWEQMTTGELLAVVAPSMQYLRGCVSLVQDESFSGAGVFRFDISQLEAFVTDYPRLEGTTCQFFSGGDIVIWSGEQKLFWIMNHEGFFTESCSLRW